MVKNWMNNSYVEADSNPQYFAFKHLVCPSFIVKLFKVLVSPLNSYGKKEEKNLYSTHAILFQDCIHVSLYM